MFMFDLLRACPPCVWIFPKLIERFYMDACHDLQFIGTVSWLCLRLVATLVLGQKRNCSILLGEAEGSIWLAGSLTGAVSTGCNHLILSWKSLSGSLQWVIATKCPDGNYHLAGVPDFDSHLNVLNPLNWYIMLQSSTCSIAGGKL